LSSTNWFVCWALVVTRTSFSAHGVVTVFTGVVGPVRFITHSCQAVCIVSIAPNIYRPRVTFVCSNIADLISSTVNISVTATQVSSATMPAHRIAGWTEAVIRTSRDTASRNRFTIFTGSVRVGRCITHVVLALIVGGAFEAFAPLAVAAFIARRAMAVLFTLGGALPSNTVLPGLTVTRRTSIGTINIAGPVTDRTVRILVLGVKRERLLTLALRHSLRTRSTFKEASFQVGSTLPKPTAI